MTHLELLIIMTNMFFFIAVVKYQVELLDGTVVAKSPDEGIEFCVNDGI